MTGQDNPHHQTGGVGKEAEDETKVTEVENRLMIPLPTLKGMETKVPIQQGYN